MNTNPKTSYNYEEILKFAKGISGTNTESRLPLPGMLMIDRITHISENSGKYGKGQIIAELDINPDLWFFKCHFIDDPVMPGSLGFDGLLQLTGFFLTHLGFTGKGRALGCAAIKFFGEVLPTSKKITYIIDVKRIINLKLTMIIADGIMQVDGNDIYTCEGMQVGILDKH
ncbi:MAG: bifunctional 3-hydroxydecanoyl-ACP dehydratase/trans-2-decenoyl-ACP isomerase [Candidatus Kapabacteria bacterium]|nr:bifunctional 3-hydroxydecanoyl-ACP dehydratase/trans-2-decenoyl-ACP isomerase [Candidatus Kapabacteria bacterium]